MEEIKKVSIEEEVKGAYIDYAMSVIAGRAIPDVRDGLKPVQRRILYSMYELGLLPGKPYKKSARVVGDTLGRFHPHGDSSVYEALVRMAQDFTMRYPLVEGQGNFGSIDGDPPAAMRYCLTGDTLVNTSLGLIKIKDIVPDSRENSDNPVDILVQSANRKINRATMFFNSGRHKTLKVETIEGYEVEGSFNHPVLVLGKNQEGRPVYIWKTLDRVNPGDYLVVSRINEIDSEKDLISEEEAILLGSLVSEGYVSDSRAGFCNVDESFGWLFEENYFSVYGKTTTLCKYKRRLKSGKLITDYQVHTKHLLDDLKEKGLDKKSAEKEIPDIILRSSKKVQRAFLRALFEGDGSVYFTKDAINIAYSSKSKKLVKQLQILLLNFGVVSRIHTDRTNYRLIISGQYNVEIFAEKIGFLTTKQHKLKYMLLKINSKGTVNSKTDFVPFLGEYIRSKYRNKGYNQWLSKHNIDRYNKLELYRDKLKEILDEEDFAFVQELLKNRYYFAKVKRVEYTGENVVYSIRVDSNCHSFVANGIINHNTEARLTKLAVEMLEDIEKNTVDMMPNFDASLQEPVVLPSKFPNLICNGTSGIAVGLATSIPPHNFKEVGEALKYLAQFPDATEEELCQFIKGPDFPTGGVITTPHEEIVNIYKSARGSITVKGKARIEKLPGNRQRIVIYEIPYQVNKVELIKKIAELVRTGKEKGISDLRDESDRTGIRIVVDLKRDANPEKVLKKLYKSTPLEKSIPVNLTVLVDKQPKVLSLREILLEFIKHRIEVITRRTQYELDKAQRRLHIVEGLLKALENPQRVIDIIRSSKDTQQARELLSSTFELSKAQADAILDMRLARFTSLEGDKLREEAENLRKDIARYQTILASEEEKIKVFIEEIDYMILKYGDERKTTISSEQELTFKENFYFGITNFGKIANFKFEENAGEDYVQKIVNSFASRLEENEKILSIQKVEGSKPVALITASGRAFWSLVIDLPKGEDKLTIEDEIAGTAYQGEGKENRIFIITKQGIIKRMFDEDIFYKSQNHLVMPLAEGDEVATAFADQENTYIGVYTANADLLLFERNEVRVTGDKAKGVEAIDMDEGDEVAGAFLLNSDRYLLVVTQQGYMKLVDREEIPVKKRGQKGVMAVKLNKDDRLCGIVPVNFGDAVLINTSGGKILRVKVDQQVFPVLKRTATGEKKFNFEAEKIIKVLKV